MLCTLPEICLQDAAKICKLIKRSPKHSIIFEKCKEALSLPGTGLRPLCANRWTVRSIATDAVLRNYTALLDALEEINEESHDEFVQRAEGILSSLVEFWLKLSNLVFSATEQVSITLQCKNTTIQEALSAAAMAESFLQQQRKDNSFEMFYSSVSQANEYNISDPVLPRYRRPPKRIDDGAPSHHFTSAKEYFRVQYFEVIDLLKGEISKRFSEKSLAVPKAVEELLINACNSNSTDENVCQI